MKMTSRPSTCPPTSLPTHPHENTHTHLVIGHGHWTQLTLAAGCSADSVYAGAPLVDGPRKILLKVEGVDGKLRGAGTILE